MSTLKRFWNEEDGVLLSLEVMVIISILIVMLFGGWTVIASAFTHELTDSAEAIDSINQDYMTAGMVLDVNQGAGGGGGSVTVGAVGNSAFDDIADDGQVGTGNAGTTVGYHEIDAGAGAGNSTFTFTAETVTTTEQ